MRIEEFKAVRRALENVACLLKWLSHADIAEQFQHYAVGIRHEGRFGLSLERRQAESLVSAGKV